MGLPMGMILAARGFNHSFNHEGQRGSRGDGDNSNVESWYPTFSPDGTKIAFTRVTFGEVSTANIFVMNVDGSNVTALPAAARTAMREYVGNKMTFVSYRNGNMEIYSMAPDGTGQTRLTSNSVYDSFSADEFGFTSSLKAARNRHAQYR